MKFLPKKILLILILIFFAIFAYLVFLNFSLTSSYITAKNSQKVFKYTSELVKKNFYKDMSANNEPFSWDKEFSHYKWKYYNGLMMYALYQTNSYDKFVEKYYFDNISPKGNIRVRGKYNIAIHKRAKLDNIMPARTLFYMGNSKNSPKYYLALEHFYKYLKSFDTLPLLGNNFRHKNNSAAWEKYPFAFDGLYSSALFLTEYSLLNHSPEDLDSAFQKMQWVAEHMKNEKGLYYHGCTEDGTPNGTVWLRGVGWYAMTQVDMIEMMKEGEKKELMKSQLKDFFDAMLKYQDWATGMWYNIVYPTNSGDYNKLETSGSAMMAYSLLKAYNLGFVTDKKYKKAGIRAFNGIVNNKLKYNNYHNLCLNDIFIARSVKSRTSEYGIPWGYLQDDAKGIAPLILTTVEITRLR